METATSGYDPIEVAIALSLYSYNVSPVDRSRALVIYCGTHNIPCLSMEEIAANLRQNCGATIATQLQYLTAKAYVEQALETYGEEAKKRVACEKAGYREV